MVFTNQRITGENHPVVYNMVSIVMGGTPKWTVYNGKSICKWMIGGYPPISGTLHIYIYNVLNHEELWIVDMTI